MTGLHEILMGALPALPALAAWKLMYFIIAVVAVIIIYITSKLRMFDTSDMEGLNKARRKAAGVKHPGKIQAVNQPKTPKQTPPAGQKPISRLDEDNFWDNVVDEQDGPKFDEFKKR